MTFKEILLSFFFLFLSLCVQGQIKNDSTQIPQRRSKAEMDSIIKAKLSLESVVPAKQTSKSNSTLKLTHSPAKATLYSLVPGLGQVYNKQAWKVPIIYAAEGVVIYFAMTNYRGAQKFKKEYILREKGIEEGRNPDYVNFPTQSIYNLYFAYQKNFELSIMGGVLIYAFNLIDAMVYGHLFDYDISPNLSLNLTPYCLPSINSSPTFGLSMKFNLK